MAYPTGSIYKIITALAALEDGVITPQTTIHDNGFIERRQPEIPQRRRRLLRAADPGPGAAGLLRRLLLRTRPADVGHQPSCSTGRTSWGSATPPGSTCPDGIEGLVPSKKLARPALRGRRQPNASLVRRRQHPARDRAGGPADQPAADGDRLRGARQRRHDRHPARRQGSPRRRRPGAEGIRLRRPGATSRSTPATGRRSSKGLHEAAQVPRRAPRRRLRRLPGRRSRARRAPRNARACRPVLVRGARSVPGPAYRHHRDHRGRRLRRRIRGARPPCRSSKPTSASRPKPSDHQRRAPNDVRHPRPPARRRAVRGPRRRSASASASPTSTGR